MRTKNTYEAALYLMFGGKLKSIEIRKVRENKRDKIGYGQECIITIDNVPLWAKRSWEDGCIHCDIVRFAAIREKLKRKMRKALMSRQGIVFGA